MKRILSILLCLILVSVTAGCAEEKEEEKPANSYEDLTIKLEAMVKAMFEEDFTTRVEEGELLSPTGELEDKWSSMLLDATKDFSNIDENAFGYKLIDINSDGSPELFFSRSDNTILAVFTINEGKPVLLDAYNRSYRCVIRDTGELYAMTISSDGTYQFVISTLHPSTGTLYTTVSFGQEADFYYESIDGDIYTTSSERISELREEYPFTNATAFTEAELHLF